MLTSSDKKYISDLFIENNKILVREMVSLFNVTNERIDQSNERIDQSNERIDKVLNKLEDHNDTLNDHERRIEKVEEKVSTTTTNPL